MIEKVIVVWRKRKKFGSELCFCGQIVRRWEGRTEGVRRQKKPKRSVVKWERNASATNFHTISATTMVLPPLLRARTIQI